MTTYLATINVPGYLPMDDDPPTFDTAKEAWAYLAEERERAEDDVDVDEDTGLQICEYSDTLAGLQYLASDGHEPGSPHEDWPTNADGTGTVYAHTPGRSSERDLGLAYSVMIVEE